MFIPGQVASDYRDREPRNPRTPEPASPRTAGGQLIMHD
jgi:hypothetical protein